MLRIVDFGGLPIFEDAKDTYVCIPLVEKDSITKTMEVCKVKDFDFLDLHDYVLLNSYVVESKQLSESGWSLENQAKTALFQKIIVTGKSLGDYSSRRIYYGIKTGLNDAFELTQQQTEKIISESPNSKNLIKPFVGGQDIRRYHVKENGRYLIVIPAGWTKNQLLKRQQNNLSESYAWEWFSKEYTSLSEHLKSFSEAAKKRQDKGDYWWELRPCDYYDVLDAPKIIYPDIAKYPRFFLDTTGLYVANTAYCLGLNDYYLLGILNSKLTWFAISQISIPFGVRAGEFRYRLIYQYMEQIPIRPINFSDPADKARHDKMVSLVERMLSLHKQPSARTPQEQEMVKREIESTDKAIDSLVYELYGLTENEVKIVEGE